MIAMGRNGKVWRKGDQVGFLYNTLNEERERAAELVSRLAKSKADSEALNAAYQKRSKALEAAKGAGDPATYNKLVDKVNRASEKYNRSVKAHNELVLKQNRSAEIINRIFEHPDDRHGVFLWVKARLKR
jgi:hypothetical protein